MPQNQQIRTTGASWDFLEPAIYPNMARLMHGRIVPAGAGLYVTYNKGQVMRQKTDGTNQWAKDGTAGFAGPVRVIKYTITVNELGYWQYGTSWNLNGQTFESTVAMYYRGYFKCQDLRGTSEVQTETVTATGGTRTLKVTDPDGVQATTAAIAYNANAAAIQAALDALANVEPGDVVVTGTGPYVYTFGGNYAQRDIPLLVVNTAGLTGGSSSFAQTGPLNTVGRLINGDYSVGILELGAAVPV